MARDYYEQLDANKLDYIEERDTFLEAYDLSRQNHTATETLSIPITSKNIE